jgi:hypothetical protein
MTLLRVLGISPLERSLSELAADKTMGSLVTPEESEPHPAKSYMDAKTLSVGFKESRSGQPR